MGSGSGRSGQQARVTWLIVVVAATAMVGVVLAFSVVVLREYERGVVFRAGRVRPLYGPGMRLRIPVLDRLVRVDQRVVTLTIPPQEVITKDNVPARVNAVVMFRITEPVKAIVAVENYSVATSQISQTTLREFFTMILMGDMAGAVVPFDELKRRLNAKGEAMGLKIDAQHEDVFKYMHRV